MRRLLLAALLLPGLARAATPCTELAPDASGRVQVEAVIPAFTPLCYAFTPGTGRQTSIRVSDADRMAFGVERVDADGGTTLLVDRRREYAFAAGPRAYRVLVASEDLHPDTTHRFTLVIEVR